MEKPKTYVTPEFRHNGILIRRPSFQDVPDYMEIIAEGWKTVYENEAAGVSAQWLKDETDSWLTEEEMADRLARLRSKLDDTENFFLYVAKDGDEVVGVINSYIYKSRQIIETLFVKPKYHGTGLAAKLMEKGVAKFDPSVDIELQVVEYNKRAIAFYAKQGFEIDLDGSGLLKEKIPVIKMVKPGITSN